MNSDYIVIEKELLKQIIDENKRLREQIKTPPKKEQPMERQISIEEYIKTLRKGKKDDRRDN